MDLKNLASLFDLKNEDVDNDKLYNELLNYPEIYRQLKKLGLDNNTIHDNMFKIIDYVRDFKYCSNCPGAGKCKKDNPLMFTNITFDNGAIGKRLEPCKKVLEAMEMMNGFVFRDIDKANVNASFLKLDKTLGRKEALKKTKEVIKNYTESKKPGWIYITGVPGTGRSYFASALANRFAERKLGDICYIDCRYRFNDLNNLFYNNLKEFNEQLSSIINCKLLVLDDFGNETIKDNVRDSIVFPIIHDRASKGLITIFVSEVPLNEIQNLYSSDKKNKTIPLRAKQIQEYIKSQAKEEINFGSVSIY